MELIKLKAKAAKFNSNKAGTRVAQNKNPKNKNDPEFKFTKKTKNNWDYHENEALWVFLKSIQAEVDGSGNILHWDGINCDSHQRVGTDTWWDVMGPTKKCVWNLEMVQIKDQKKKKTFFIKIYMRLI